MSIFINNLILTATRALLMNPAIILGDEPTGDLDQDTSTDIMNLFVSINENYEQTFLVVTHSEHIAKFCHRIIRIVDGEIVDDGKLVKK